MLELNLISPSKKQKLEALVKFLFIKEYAEMFVLTACVLGVMHVAAWLLLSSTVDDLSQSTLLVSRDFSSYNQVIKDVNSTILSVSKSSDKWTPVTNQLNDLAQALPPRVKLNSIVLDRAQSTLTLSGIAETRDALLSFQQQLQAISWIQSVDLPNSDLFQKENASFDITATIKGEKPPLVRMKKPVQITE